MAAVYCTHLPKAANDSSIWAHTIVPPIAAGPWVASLAAICSPGLNTPCPWLAGGVLGPGSEAVDCVAAWLHGGCGKMCGGTTGHHI
ncbi:hypothetical protein HaLaN_26577, partial [Haematococcus lacustris]